MLHAVSELSEHCVRHIQRVLGHEIDTHALGPDQPDDLFDLFQQRRRRIVEQQMRLVEKEHQLRFFRIANLGQFLE